MECSHSPTLAAIATKTTTATVLTGRGSLIFDGMAVMVASNARRRRPERDQSRQQVI
jgi:hypothetical protein